MIESEKDIERFLCRAVKEKGGLAIKLLTSQMIGLPDRLCLFPIGRVVFVEVKTTGQKPRKIQAYVHKQLMRLGFRVKVIDSTKGVIDLCNEY